MNEKETLTVYWAPAQFIAADESWNMLYSEPENILAKFMRDKKPGADMAMCPSVKGLMKNTFALSSNLNDQLIVDPLVIAREPEKRNRPLAGQSKISFFVERSTSFEGYANISYNLKWLFFSEEPVEMKLTAPYFPATALCEGALFSPGRMNVGLWYRALSLDWHIPLTTTEINIKEGQELAYVEFETDKKVILKRYTLSSALAHMAVESSRVPWIYEKNLPLAKRYEMAKKANVSQLVLNEIKKNLVV